MSPFIHPAFWSDPEIESASAEVKLTVLWLITNSQTSIIGLCRATEKRFAFETGLPGDTLRQACAALPKMLFAAAEGIWIRNYIHHQFGRGDKLTRNNCFKAIRAAFSQVREEKFQKEIVTQYPEFSDPSTFEDKPLLTPSEPLPRGKVREEKGRGENPAEEGQGETSVEPETLVTGHEVPREELHRRVAAAFHLEPREIALLDRGHENARGLQAIHLDAATLGQLERLWGVPNGTPRGDVKIWHAESLTAFLKSPDKDITSARKWFPVTGLLPAVKRRLPTPAETML